MIKSCLLLPRGDWDSGTLFVLATNGTGFVTLHSFTGGSDGATLLQQKRYAETEPLLVSVYQGMKEDEAKMVGRL